MEGIDSENVNVYYFNKNTPIAKANSDKKVKHILILCPTCKRTFEYPVDVDKIFPKNAKKPANPITSLFVIHKTEKEEHYISVFIDSDLKVRGASSLINASPVPQNEIFKAQIISIGDRKFLRPL